MTDPRRILVRAGKDPLVPLSAERSLSIRRDGVFGSNAGNMLFYTAAWRTLLTDDVDLVADGYKSERAAPRRTAARIDADYDAFVLPLANAFRRSFLPQLDRLTDVISRLHVPVSVLGVGAQFRLGSDVADAPDELRRSVRAFVAAVLERSPSVGVRGAFTRDFVVGLGFRDSDVDVIGCPSLYGFSGSGEIRQRGPLSADSALAVTYSPYLRDVGPFVDAVTRAYPQSVVVPQTVEALALLLHGEPTSYAEKTELPESASHPLYREGRMRFFVDASTWIDGLRDRDLVVGTRIHGTIAGLLAGVPSILIAHDSRTRELAEFHAIPYQGKKALRRLAVEEWYHGADFDAFTARHRTNIAGFEAFLERHSFPHTLSEDRPRFDRQLSNVRLAPAVTPGGAPPPAPAAVLRRRASRVLRQFPHWK